MLCFNCMRDKGDAIVCPYCGAENIPDDAAHHLPPGTVIGGRYTLGRVLGEGGFGITYIGFDQTLDILVAVKEYYPYGFTHRTNTVSNAVTVSAGDYREFFEKGKKRFLNEAKNVARFRNEPGIVNVTDFIEENNTAYIVMEYLDGIDLRQYLRQYGAMTVEQTLTLLKPVIKTLGKMHEAGIIHRDISPDNIMYLRDGTLRLMDFGAARDYVGDNRSMSVMLKQGYAPEEQYRRNGEQGPWTDVYGICATIYRCITGRTPVESLDRIFEDTLARPSALGVAISPQTENVLMYGLAVRKNDRIQSMPELQRLLENAQANKTAPIPRAAAPVNYPNQPTGYAGPTVYANTVNTNVPPSQPIQQPSQPSQPVRQAVQSAVPIRPAAPVQPAGATPTAQNNKSKKSILAPVLIGATAITLIVVIALVVIVNSLSGNTKRSSRSAGSSSASSLSSSSGSASSSSKSSSLSSGSSSAGGTSDFSVSDENTAADRLEKTVNYVLGNLDMSGYTYSDTISKNGKNYYASDDQSYYYTDLVCNASAYAFGRDVKVEGLDITVGKTTLGDLMNMGCEYYSSTSAPEANSSSSQVVSLRYDDKRFCVHLWSTGSDVKAAVVGLLWLEGPGYLVPFNKTPIEFSYNGVTQESDIKDVMNKLGPPQKMEIKGHDTDYSDKNDYGDISFLYTTTDAKIRFIIDFKYNISDGGSPKIETFRLAVDD